MSAASRGADWIRLAATHRTDALGRYGIQFQDGFDPQPFTPGGYALSVFGVWSRSIRGVFEGAAAEGKVPPLALAESPAEFLEAGTIFVSALPGKVADLAESIAVKQAARKIGEAQRVMLDAMAKSVDQPARDFEGRACLSATEAARYWAAVSSWAIQNSFLAARTSVPLSERLDAAAEGARDGFAGVGEAVGTAARFAGEAVGSVAGGFFEGFGAVNLIVLAGGAYVATKVF